MIASQNIPTPPDLRASYIARESVDVVCYFLSDLTQPSISTFFSMLFLLLVIVELTYNELFPLCNQIATQASFEITKCAYLPPLRLSTLTSQERKSRW